MRFNWSDDFMEVTITAAFEADEFPLTKLDTNRPYRTVQQEIDQWTTRSWSETPMGEWVQDNLSDVTIVRASDLYSVNIEFLDRNAALLFKLTWGGVQHN